MTGHVDLFENANRQSDEAAEVFEKEEKTMIRAFNDVREKAVKRGCTHRTGAFVQVLDRVYKASVVRGW